MSPTHDLDQFLIRLPPQTWAFVRAMWFKRPVSGIHSSLFIQIAFLSVHEETPCITVECSGVHAFELKSSDVYGGSKRQATLWPMPRDASGKPTVDPHEYLRRNPELLRRPDVFDHLLNPERLRSLWNDRNDGEPTDRPVSNARVLVVNCGFVVADEFRIVALTPGGPEAHALLTEGSRPIADT